MIYYEHGACSGYTEFTGYIEFIRYTEFVGHKVFARYAVFAGEPEKERRPGSGDYLMMTPVLVTGNGAAVIGSACAWIVSAAGVDMARHSERFMELTNENLSCGRCEHPKSCVDCVRSGSFFGRKSSELEKFDAKNRKINEE